MDLGGLMKCILDVNQLSKKFDSKYILKDLSFKIYEGEIFVILGESGAGKTTLLNSLSNINTDYEGTIWYHEEIFKDRLVPLPVVFQDFDQLFPWLNVKDNILLPFGRKDFNSSDKDIIDFVGLEEHLDKFPKELSGGMKQRAAIARSLLSDAKVIFMDEPFGSLDVQRRSQLQRLILQINEKYKKTIIFITHDLEEADFLATRIAIIDDRGNMTIRDNK